MADEDAVFRVLCQLSDTSPPDRGSGGAARAFLDALEGVEGVDDVPDFSTERSREQGKGAAQEDLPAGDPQNPSDRDALIRELIRGLSSYQRLLERYSRDFDEVFARRSAGAAEEDDQVVTRLRDVQRVLIKYPVAAQAAFAALVREGRRFAATPDGSRWSKRLSASPLVARARTIFEGLSSGVVAEGGDALPSAYVHAFVQALDREIERLLTDVRSSEKSQ